MLDFGFGQAPFEARTLALQAGPLLALALAMVIAMMRRRRCQDEIVQAVDRISSARQAQSQARGNELRDYQAYLERMEQSHRLLVEELARHEKEVADRRATLTARSQDRQALEKLKEKGLDAHNCEVARIEQITLDEIAGNGYWRRAA